MNENNSLDYITNFLSETSDRIKKIHKKVKHGKLKVQRKKVKSQVLKDAQPKDYKRHAICKNARKKAHTSVANAKRNISNGVRNGLAEGLIIINPKALTLSESYGLDFLEEAAGYSDINIEFFDKPVTTPITEGLVVGKTPKGRDKKCKAIGIAEGVFAPIRDSEGNSVFSRNNRLYESDHWDYQLENQNLVDRVATRRMLGTIGHYDKKVDDKDLAEGKVSHIVTNLEIREDDENGRYLWGRLEILNTPAGRLLKEYYDNDIPLFVSSRGGGKLLDIPGKDYKVVDKARYFCETFDVVKEPGFLEACPHYHNEDAEEINAIELIARRVAEEIGLQIDEDKLEEVVTTLSAVSESVENSNEIDEDSNMKDINCNVTATDNVEEILKKLVKPLAESIQELTQAVETIKADIYESEETPAEEVTEEAPAEEVVAPAEEAPEVVEEPAQEEAPAEEKVEEAAEEVVEPAEVSAEEVTTEEPVVEAKSEEKEEKVEDPKEETEDDAKEKKCDCKEEVEQPAEEITEAPAQEETPAEEKVEEQWAHIDPKETAPETKETPEANQPAAQDVIKDGAWANEDPKETAPEKSAIANAENAPVEHEDDAHEEKPAVDGAVIKEEAEASEEVPAGMEQVVDYKAMYEGLETEVKEATRLISEMTALFKDFGKRYSEVVSEAKEKEEKLQEQLDAANKSLNSYKLMEKFNITVEQANEMLSSKSYETVEEELKEAEATKLQEEAQAKVEQVSESIQPDVIPAEAPVSKKRKAYSAFSAISEEKISEEEAKSAPKRKTFSWFN